MALAVTHVESGRTWRHNEHLRLPSASLIKLPILAAFWETVEAGRLDPGERVSVPAEALRVEGKGGAEGARAWAAADVERSGGADDHGSDNVVTNLIIDRLGMEAIQGWIDKAGLGETRIERRMDRSAMSAGRGNWTSAADMETLLLAIAAGTCVSGEASRELGRALEAQQIQDRLARRLGDGVHVANKTGNFADVIHDAGIMTWPSGTLVIAVLTQGVRPPWQVIDVVAEIAGTSSADVCQVVLNHAGGGHPAAFFMGTDARRSVPPRHAC